MEINWFTVIAQVINFLILVWLLKRFLYKPVLNAIDEREKKIASQLSDAAAKKAEAKKERDLFQQKNEEFDNQRRAQLTKVQEEAKAEKQKLFEEVRNESIVLRAKYEDSLQQEGEDIAESLKRKMQDEVFAIAQKTLSDLASVSIEEQLVDVFAGQIKNLKEEERNNFRSALFNNNKMLVIKSAFELPPSSKSKLENVIAEITGNSIKFQYQTSPELVSGIEVNAENYKVSWNIDAYLDTLKKDITSSLPFKQKENASLQV